MINPAKCCSSGSKSLPLVPKPVSVEHGKGCFVLTSDTILVTDEASKRTAVQLAAFLRPASGFNLAIASSAGHNGTIIALAQDKDMADLGSEGYRLEVTPERVSLTAPTQAGLFYAIQTLRQLLPPLIFSTRPMNMVEWRIPCLKINDHPRFEWRGLMLDTGHDFQHVPFILRFIDLMALHKFNTLHWHITDLGTFPLEIKNYPRLQDPASLGTRMRGEPKRGVKPGRYTQTEVREIVKYAAARHITVVPEIDMPGHSTPALIAYPEFDCPVSHKTGEWDRWEYCVGNEKTYGFLQDILTQVIELFPSEFIHIGGDECPKDHWKKCPICQAKMKAENLQNEDELQSYFVRRIEKFLNSKGRRLIGWDEILEGGLAPNAAVMAWRVDKQAATIAAKAGHDVVMALTSHLYFDFPETTTPLEKVYSFEPVPQGLTPEQASHILGAQAQMWTDNHPTEKEIERLVYPRACAVSEVVWSQADPRDDSGFVKRLSVHSQRLAALGIDFEVSAGKNV
ncbi:MAG: beta-N-acetylhexosaminidase [Verrucomicrobia bacterium]|nr:beta-N-acetylhexosaminidase [Verrucomicrobiota bacterium]MCG2681934.1 beta-N-acetylhexosaminidase [Kiritimatiellia bacterium]MBU4247134.1 beta-N-acetylhexosaminidase [Verrucomicrobiota bacterium]MBU4290975.1 beta-N-acetylhexosaminidase [Verrucomicrobiota bacterium]MBU4430430.1 beta-N-acetylhexosaminidase [Verrucomicrobiota bacterium]